MPYLVPNLTSRAPVVIALLIKLFLFLQVDCPFIVCMTYAFHTPDKLCFILDLMNGGDLHYHLSQHGVFNEAEMKFYAAEVILGLYTQPHDKRLFDE